MYRVGKDCQIPVLPKLYDKYFSDKKDGFFVDVGAHDGESWSNTIGLAEAGWSGICFEPQSSKYMLLMHKHRDRNNVKCIKRAISDFNGETKLYLGGSLSTISEEQRDLYLQLDEFSWSGLKSGEYEIVTVSKLNDELVKNKAPLDFDVLSIDVEGSEFDVLCSFDIEIWMPKMVIIEVHESHKHPSLRRQAFMIDGYFDAAKYYKIYSDTINNIYVSEVL